MKHTMVEPNTPVDATTDSPDRDRRLAKLDRVPLKLLRFTAVRERTGLSRSTIWRLERRGAFPKHVRISANVVAWLEDEIVAWIRAKMSQVSA